MGVRGWGGGGGWVSFFFISTQKLGHCSRHPLHNYQAWSGRILCMGHVRMLWCKGLSHAAGIHPTPTPTPPRDLTRHREVAAVSHRNAFCQWWTWKMEHKNRWRCRWNKNMQGQRPSFPSCFTRCPRSIILHTHPDKILTCVKPVDPSRRCCHQSSSSS